jgi:hypothetical protein
MMIYIRLEESHQMPSYESAAGLFGHPVVMPINDDVNMIRKYKHHIELYRSFDIYPDSRRLPELSEKVNPSFCSCHSMYSLSLSEHICNRRIHF